MRKYLTAYLAFIDKMLEQKSVENIEETKAEHLRQIQFMQHERLIHLMVTILFALMLFISLGIMAITDKAIFAVLAVLILLPLVPYIWHYYFLENSVQKMYIQYNKMCISEENSPLQEIPRECLKINPASDI